MPRICFRQRTPNHKTTAQVGRAIKGGSILRNVTDTIQECGTSTIPKDRTDQPTIPGKCLYTIPDIGMVVNIITMSNEGGVNCPERRQTTKHDY